jgi:hypothetical protein
MRNYGDMHRSIQAGHSAWEAFLNGTMERLIEPDTYIRNKLPEFVLRGDFGHPILGHRRVVHLQDVLRCLAAKDLYPHHVMGVVICAPVSPSTFMWIPIAALTRGMF